MKQDSRRHSIRGSLASTVKLAVKLAAALVVVTAGAGCALFLGERPESFVQHAADAPRHSILGGAGVATLLVNEESCGSSSVSFGLLELETGAEVAEHVHPASSELIFTIGGTGVLTLDGVAHPVTAGTVVLVPPGVPHAFRVTSQQSWRGTQVYSPAGPEARFRSAPLVER